MASPELLTRALRPLSSGAWQEAETAARAAIADDPDDPHAALLLGLAVAAMGEADRAAPLLTHAGAMRPDACHPCLELARLKPTLPRALIARQFRACLRQAQSDDRLRLDFATFLLDTDQAVEAKAILADGPASVAGHHLMGLVEAELSHFMAAIDSFECALALEQDNAASWSNLGMMLKVEGRFDQAIAAHDRAVALDPANHRLRVNRAVALLKKGDWEPAWLDYESRLVLTVSPLVDLDRLLPTLRPADRLAGLTILALHEDGFGDTLQFLRYLPLLAERGATLVARVPPALERVMRMVPGVTDVVTDPQRLPAHDFVCPMFSLPRVFSTTVDTIPPAPVLLPDASLVRYWANRLPSGGLRVGLVWAGQARPSLSGFGTLDRRRSAGLAALAPLFDVPGVAFVSLQAGPPSRQMQSSDLLLADPMPDVSDFADTAAIIAGLDLVISVDTSVVHIAGLLGKPVFLLDRYDGCWRWLSGRSDSPWYPRLTIFRQQQCGDWSEPVTQAKASLKAMVLDRGLGVAAHAVVT
jgi:tetratricopeptide (TPR) repeat protein